MANARVAIAAGAYLVGACGGSVAQPASGGSAASAASAALPTPSTVTSFQGARWATFHSKRFEMSIQLPDGSAWKIDDHRSPWLRATHEPTRSKLAVRSWYADENVTRQACYSRAREWDPTLPDLETSALIEDGLRSLLDSKGARVAVGLAGRSASPATAGFVVAIVGEVRRCTVIAYQTEAGGPSAEDHVGERLAAVTGRLLPSLKMDHSFAPSRERAMPSPGGPGGVGGVR